MKNKFYISALTLFLALNLTGFSVDAEAYNCQWHHGHKVCCKWHNGRRVCWSQRHYRHCKWVGGYWHHGVHYNGKRVCW